MKEPRQYTVAEFARIPWANKAVGNLNSGEFSYYRDQRWQSTERHVLIQWLSVSPLIASLPNIFMKRFFYTSLFAALLALLALSSSQAEEASQLFVRKIRPLLESKCFDCHSARAEEVKGNLKLDSLEAIFKGGDNGAAVLPGDIENSFLLKAIRYQEADYQMPPSGKLSDADIQMVEQWVRELAGSANKRRLGK